MPDVAEAADGDTERIFVLIARVVTGGIIALSLLTVVPLVLLSSGNGDGWGGLTNSSVVLGAIGAASVLLGAAFVVPARRSPAMLIRLAFSLAAIGCGVAGVMWGFIAAIASHAVWPYVGCVALAIPVWALAWPSRAPLATATDPI